MSKSDFVKLLPIILLLVFLAVGAAGYFFFQYRKTQSELELLRANPAEAQKMTQEDTKKLISAVGKLMELPTDEEPQVVTVADVSKLQDQPFFAHAKNGDKVLIYTKNKKAILYDPTSKKIVDVAPVSSGSDSAQIAPAGQPDASPQTSDKPASSSAKTSK